MSDQIEKWISIPGFDGYEVSSSGRIKSNKKKKPKIMATEVDKDGYQRVQLRKNGAHQHLFVSRIVCTAFNGPSPVGFEICCHNDNDKSNNTPRNLRWDSQKGNVADKVGHGTHQIGSKHPKSIITEADAVRVKAALRSYAGKRGKNINASLVTGVSYNIVADIARGRTWGHV